MSRIYDPRDIGKIRRMEDLFKELKDFQNSGSGGAVYLRGHAIKKWGLEPSIARKNQYRHGNKKIKKFSARQERSLLHRFRRYSHAVLARAIDPWEGLFLAKHHDLPSRLLDWTSNPLVALFNAVEPNTHFDEDGAVWLMKRRRNTANEIDVLEDARDPLDIPGVRIIYPTYVSPRMIVQSGFFTLHAYPWHDLRELDSSIYSKVDLDIVRVKKLVVRQRHKMKLLDQLERAGINTRTLFPDLDHLAKGLWQLEAIRKP